MIFVGDIGGTNSRFAIFSKADNRLLARQQRKNAGFTNFYTLLADVLSSPSMEKVPAFDRACLAVASPVAKGQASLTNLGRFQFDEKRLSQVFYDNLSRRINVRLVNDFVALAHALPYLEKTEYKALLDQPRQAGKPCVVLGPGTGLGAGILTQSGSGTYQAIASEGGHIAPPIRSRFELDVICHIQDTLDGAFIDSELVVSGPGIERVYSAISKIRTGKSVTLPPDQITENALNTSDNCAVETVKLVARWLMRIAASQALMIKPYGGMFLAGGVLPHLLEWLQTDEILEEFKANRRMALVVDAIPLLAITTDDAGLIGAAHCP